MLKKKSWIVFYKMSQQTEYNLLEDSSSGYGLGYVLTSLS